MSIGLTKKLIDQLKIKPVESQEERELFTWTANILTINRKKAVVVVNNYSRYGFILYGLRSKEFKGFDSLITNGIKESLQQLRIKEDIITKYMEELKDVKFTKTKGPKYVSRLVKACERVEYFADYIHEGNTYQYNLSKKMNNDLLRLDKDNYKEPDKLMVNGLFEYFKEEVVQCEGVMLEVSINLGYYIATRTITTPNDITFEVLHEIIQKAFEWKGYHLHEFIIQNSKGEEVLNVISEHEEIIDRLNAAPVRYEKEVHIRDFMNENHNIIYHYDYGDSWEHMIKVVSIISDYNKNEVVCTEAYGDAPPEDVGGIYGFRRFYDIMQDENHPDYDEVYDWGTDNGYCKVDIRFINFRLGLLP